MHSQRRPTADVKISSRPSQRLTSETQQPPSPSVDDGRTCPDCGSEVPIVDTSESTCPDCQIVVTETPVSTAPRPRYDDDDGSRVRTGSRLTWLYADRGLGAGVGPACTGASPPDRDWTHPLKSQEYRLDYALGEIRRMGAELNVPSSELEGAARLYCKAHEEGVVRGRCVEGFAAACLLVAVRQSSLRLPVSQHEIGEVMRATRDQFRTARGVLEVELRQKVPPMDPRDFLPQVASAVSAPHRVQACAETLIESYLADESAPDISPRTLTGAAIHAAFDLTECDRRPTLTELSQVMNVATSTISARKSDLLAYRDTWE